MAPKRKGDDLVSESNAPTSRERKKQKVNAAREIAVQGQPTASSSKTTLQDINKKGKLPGVVDVERFVESRKFEIQSMEEAMESAKGASTHRAWQELPRHLRRRAASHDVRRVPVRLRGKALAEMDPAKRKVFKRTLPKRGKFKKLTRTQDFLKRQTEKTWLETHIWHAKRMHMEVKWGYSLAVTPTEKSYRPSHRAAQRGAILNDVSYVGTIEMCGPQSLIISALQQVVDPQGHGPGSRQFVGGARMLNTYAYGHLAYPFGALGPISVLWKPPVDALPMPTVNQATINASKFDTKGKGALNEEISPPIEPSESTVRTCWIRVHPAIFEATFDTLKSAASSVLEVYRTSGKVTEGLQLADLREELCAFESMGPKATQVLKGALDPAGSENKTEFKQFWSSLKGLQSSNSVPRGMAIGFQVLDPRLRFPPKMAKVHTPIALEGFPTLESPTVMFPTSKLAHSPLWESELRDKLAVPQFKKQDLDTRRAENLVPGTKLKATPKDARIPVILVQRSIEGSSMLNTGKASAVSTGFHGWTLLVPAGWGMPFLSSLLFTGARVGGLRERAVQEFESGIPSFPVDAVDTDAHWEEVEARAQILEDKWYRTPPAKRINYEQRGEEDPWRPNWLALLGIELEELAAEGDGFLDTQRNDSPSADEGMNFDDHPQSSIANNVDVPMGAPDSATGSGPWVVRGDILTRLPQILSSQHDAPVELFRYINDCRTKRDMQPLLTPPDHLWNSGLVQVRLEMCGRGKPMENSTIYSLTDAEYWSWTKIHRSGGPGSMEDEGMDEIQLAQAIPEKSTLVGFVTSGNSSLTTGYAQAIGALSLAKFQHIFSQAQRLYTPETRLARVPLVKIRDRDGLVCRAARVYVI